MTLPLLSSLRPASERIWVLGAMPAPIRTRSAGSSVPSFKITDLALPFSPLISLMSFSKCNLTPF